MVKLVEALTIVVPVSVEVRFTVQEPVASIVVQFSGLRLPGPLSIVKLMVVLAWAGTQPGDCVVIYSTCAVRR